jgi:hypothetical protein
MTPGNSGGGGDLGAENLDGVQEFSVRHSEDVETDLIGECNLFSALCLWGIECPLVYH